MHNFVNVRLKKPEVFNKLKVKCGNNLYAIWGGNEDCGCGAHNLEPTKDDLIHLETVKGIKMTEE